MKLSWLSLVLIVLFCYTAETSHFRGGTISWRYVGPGNRVEFKFKLAWRLGMASTSTWSAMHISGGSSTTMFSGSYVQTASNSVENWEEGERTFQYNLPSKGPFRVFFTGAAWISLSYGGGGGSWKIETTVDLHHRSDTYTPNRSPQTTSRAIYRVQYGCHVTLQIPVVDADGDNVRCRWATSAEASSIALIFPNANLDRERCRISFTANSANSYVNNGWFAVAVTIEDFPRKTTTINGKTYNPSTPISQVPLQFLVRPETMSGSCSDKPVFDAPTLAEGTVTLLKAGHTFTTGFYVRSNTSLRVIDITGHTGISKSPISPDDQGRSKVWRVVITWTPTQADKGTHIICASAEDTNRKLSDSRCIAVVAWDVDPCESNPCVNLGTCDRVGLSEDYVCACLPGYTGKNCQTDINECTSNPCQHGGDCLDLINEYRCHCKDGYTGLNCQTDINECASNPCRNDATCQDLVNGYVCHCAAGYTSTHCEIDIDECASDPCMNNGTCVDKVASWSCACQPGYTGLQCQIDIDECASNPCRNNGTCIDLVDEFSCQCTNDSAGVYCETWMNHCASFPCLHGGQCENHLGGFTCSCPDTWNGDVCEFRDINRTETCRDLEYTECSCRITLPKHPVKKSYMIESGAVGMMTGLLATVAFYIVWSLCGQNSPNIPTSNKVQCKEDLFIEDFSGTQNEDAKSKTSEHSNDSKFDDSSTSDQMESQQGCDCFIDHTGYNHFQRRDENDKHNYRYHKCRGRQSKLNTSLNSSKC